MGHIFSRETGVSEIASENRDADDEITDASVNNTNSEEFSDHLTPSNGNSASNENAEQSGVVEEPSQEENLASNENTEQSGVMEEPSQEENLASNENTEQSGVVGEPSQEENLASNENTEQSASGSVKNQQELAGRDEGLVSDATTESSAVKPGDFKGFKTKNEDTINKGKVMLAHTILSRLVCFAENLENCKYIYRISVFKFKFCLNICIKPKSNR